MGTLATFAGPSSLPLPPALARMIVGSVRAKTTRKIPARKAYGGSTLVRLAVKASPRAELVVYFGVMNPKQREALAEKLMDVANYAAGALLIGQIIGKEFILAWTLLGGAIWLSFYAISLYFLHD
jgi:hypothetical protein